MYYIKKLINLLSKYPKYLSLIIKILFTNKVDSVSYLHNEVNKYNYEKIEGFLINKQIDVIEEYFKDKINILEIGFNLGHTTEAFIEKSNASVVSVDIFRHAYSWIARIYFTKNFKKRIQFYRGDSKVVLEKLTLQEKKYDLILIDGGHTYDVAKSDVENSIKLLNKNGILIIDNLEMKSVYEAVNEFVHANKIELISKKLFKRQIGKSDIGIYQKS